MRQSTSQARAPDPTDSAPADAEGFLSPRPGSQPGSRCYRCGKPTPPGISLCEADNPGSIKGPSTTQLHATILVGVIVGAVVLLIGAKVTSGRGGPYTAAIVSVEMGADGAPAVVATVTNTGAESGVANCRVTRDGAPRPDDPTYRTELIEPGASVPLARTIPAPPVTTAAYDPERMTVTCT